MKFIPKNKFLLIDFFEEDVKKEETRLKWASLQPEKRSGIMVVKLLAAADDCKETIRLLPEGSKIMIFSHLIEENEFEGNKIILIPETAIIGSFEETL